MPIVDPYNSYSGPSGFPNEDCTPTALPTVSFANCPEGYMPHESEIVKIFVTNAEYTSGAFVADVAPADWTVSANYAVAGIQTLVGFGDKPLAEAVTVPLPNNQLKTIRRNHTVNFSITDMTEENYEFIRSLQGAETVVIWYLTIDGYIFGGADGIVCRIANAGTLLNRGENALAESQIVFTWRNLFDPPMSEIDPPAPLMAGKVKAPAPLKSKTEAQPA